ncbi:hypothetical protein OEW28_10455 [Defluviimonas sp. WL0002]|uniref:DUF2541 family protein n=1 Tax=Albidovulum marisflavi TaxID=2984159 RepID=A0ABT2ZD83_9RHOB|nr:hypothetical protein [Defluviimonas sp. WL0002]MCV2869046.1 hypothetical protein [Defluviimonas sp. WL0002]
MMLKFRNIHFDAFACLVLAATIISLSAVPAVAESWKKLGSRNVMDHRERDRIPVGGRRYDEIRICVSDARVTFYDVDVRFENGGSQNVVIQRTLRNGECTRAIDLRGNDRNIDVVVFRYETGTLGIERAKVTLFGR